MIIKSLLFIILFIYCYETYKNISKLSEEYFITLEKSNTTAHTNDYSNVSNDSDNKYTTERFVELSGDPELDDISKTIAINCKAYPDTINNIMVYKPEANSNLDTPYYAQYKPLEYTKDRQYYWKRNKLVEEGIRRSNDDKHELSYLQSLFDNETDINKKKILQDELDLFKWHNNIFKLVDYKTGISREKRDIITDYYPEEIGLQRPWIERHSHLPDYSY
jgi:hypothetical protein